VALAEGRSLLLEDQTEQQRFGRLLDDGNRQAWQCIRLADQLQECLRQGSGSGCYAPGPAERAQNLANIYLDLRRSLRQLSRAGDRLYGSFYHVCGMSAGRLEASPLECQRRVYELTAAVCDAVALGLGLEPGGLDHIRRPDASAAFQDALDGRRNPEYARAFAEWSKAEELTHTPEGLAPRFAECHAEVCRRVAALPEIDCDRELSLLERGKLEGATAWLLLSAARKVLG